MKLTDSNDSEKASTSAPRRPWITSMAIHHSETASDSPPIRTAVARARRQLTWRSAAATSSHRTGAGAIIMMAVALTDPTVAMTIAASAA